MKLFAFTESFDKLKIRVRQVENDFIEVLFVGDINPETISMLKSSPAMAEILKNFHCPLVLNLTSVSDLSIAFLDILAELSSKLGGSNITIKTHGNDYIYYRTKKLCFENFCRILH